MKIRNFVNAKRDMADRDVNFVRRQFTNRFYFLVYFKLNKAPADEIPKVEESSDCQKCPFGSLSFYNQNVYGMEIYKFAQKKNHQKALNAKPVVVEFVEKHFVEIKKGMRQNVQ